MCVWIHWFLVWKLHRPWNIQASLSSSLSACQVSILELEILVECFAAYKGLTEMCSWSYLHFLFIFNLLSLTNTVYLITLCWQRWCSEEWIEGFALPLTLIDISWIQHVGFRSLLSVGVVSFIADGTHVHVHVKHWPVLLTKFFCSLC